MRHVLLIGLLLRRHMTRFLRYDWQTGRVFDLWDVTVQVQTRDGPVISQKLPGTTFRWVTGAENVNWEQSALHQRIVAARSGAGGNDRDDFTVASVHPVPESVYKCVFSTRAN